MSYSPDGNGRLYVLDPTNNREEIRLISRVAYVPETAPTTQNTTLDQGQRTNVGRPGPGEVTFDFQPHPGFAGDQRLEAAHETGTGITLIHERGAPDSVLDNPTAADTLTVSALAMRTGWGSIAPAGAVGFGTDRNPTAPWEAGLGLRFDGTDILFMIESIISDDELRIRRYGTIAAGIATPDEDPVAIAAIAASPNWQLLAMGVRHTYQGRVATAGGEDNSGAGDVGSSAQIVLSSRRSTVLMLP